jgi:hypothetical protein
MEQQSKENVQSIMDRVKTYEDACAIKGVAPESVFNESDAPDEIAEKKIKLIVEVLNEGWKPDLLDTDTYKYFPYFYINSGGGLSFLGYDCGHSSSGVGARLLLETSEKAEYIGQQFTDLYKTYLTGK